MAEAGENEDRRVRVHGAARAARGRERQDGDHPLDDVARRKPPAGEVLPPHGVPSHRDAQAPEHRGDGGAEERRPQARPPAFCLDQQPVVRRRVPRRLLRAVRDPGSLEAARQRRLRRRDRRRALRPPHERSPLLKAFDVSLESESVRKAYGIGDGQGSGGKGGGQKGMQRADKFGEGVLMARRLVEVGVPFVEVTLGGWDTHQDNFNRVSGLGDSLAPAFAALIKDLEDRNLLESTLILCMGEFGRTPVINGNDGRDHFPGNFSIAMAGGGVKGGQVLGATTDDGMSVAKNPLTVPDLMATVCTSIGIDHTEWFQTPVGRPIQIANKGKLIEGLLT
ncbi:MAG: DUF1501 domain-containing protein [Planctomycetes bacterium]|nr:DUF1501 domain-containing protein [Planctomycetota bacterium]